MTGAVSLALLLMGPPDTPEILERGGLELRLPTGWREAAPPQNAHGTVTVTLGPRDGPGFRLLLTVMHARTASLDTRALANEQGRKLLPTALETSLKVEELRGDAGLGHYYALTDRTPKPGEFERLVQGVVTYGELHVSFTLLTHRADDPARAAALELLRRARRVRHARP